MPTYAIQPADQRADAPAGRVIPLDPDALLFETEAAYLTALSPRTLQMLRQKGGGPQFVHLGQGGKSSMHRTGVRYQRRTLLEWIDRRRRNSTSDPGTLTPAPAGEGG
jgi:hypothetical protein